MNTRSILTALLRPHSSEEQTAARTPARPAPPSARTEPSPLAVAIGSARTSLVSALGIAVAGKNRIKLYAGVTAVVLFLAVGGYLVFAPKPAPFGDQIVVGRDEAAKAQAERQRADEEAAAEAKQKADADARQKVAAEAQAAAGPQPVGGPHFRYVDAALKNLLDANVAFNTPEHARLRKQIIIEAILSRHLSQGELKSLIKEQGAVEVGTLKISRLMGATLSGGSAFDIESISPPQQLISEKEETHWSWIVTPKTVGEQILILSFDAVISIEGRDYNRSIRTFTKRIDVDVGWPETLGEWLELARKTIEDVSYLWAAILVPIGAAVWTVVRKRGQPTNANVGNRRKKDHRKVPH